MRIMEITNIKSIINSEGKIFFIFIFKWLQKNPKSPGSMILSNIQALFSLKESILSQVNKLPFLIGPLPFTPRQT